MITGRAGGPATTRGVLGEITCGIAASIPTTRWRSGPVAAAVWLWSLRWSSAHEPPLTADTPCFQPKQAWDQPKLRRKERRKLRMRTSVGRSSEPPSELRARSEPRPRPNPSRMQADGGKEGAAAHFGDSRCGATARAEAASATVAQRATCRHTTRNRRNQCERIDAARRRCGTDAPSPNDDVAEENPVPVQMWHGCAQWQGRPESRRRCGRDEPSPGAYVAWICPVPGHLARMRPVPAQMWQGCA